MTVIIYSETTEGATERLLQSIGALNPRETMYVCQSVAELSKRLKQPAIDQRIVILLVAFLDELQALLSIRDLLDDCRVIVALPSDYPNIVAMGHRLHPRFMTDYQSDFSDLAAVFHQMVRHIACQDAYAGYG